MPETTARFKRMRRSLVGLVMLAVLLASTALAWLLVRGHEAPTRRAVSILATIRSQGLGPFWSGPYERWFIVSQGRQAVGWRAVVRTVSQDGSLYEGLEVEFFRGLARGNWAHWGIDSKATEAAYRGGRIVSRGPLRLPPEPTTVIDFGSGRVTVSQRTDRGWLQSAADVPEAYLPQAIEPLAWRLVARERTTAKFRMVFNRLPPAGDRTRFGSALMEYEGPYAEGGSGSAQLAVRYATMLDSVTATYSLDRDGNVIGRSDPTYTDTAATRAAVVKAFPEAPGLLEYVGKAERFGQAASLRKMRPAR
jgi:hypothetical protein